MPLKLNVRAKFKFHLDPLRNNFSHFQKGPQKKSSRVLDPLNFTWTPRNYFLHFQKGPQKFSWTPRILQPALPLVSCVDSARKRSSVMPQSHAIGHSHSIGQNSINRDSFRGPVLARLRVWDAMLCNVDAQTSKFSFSKGSRFFSLDPMKLTAKQGWSLRRSKPILTGKRLKPG